MAEKKSLATTRIEKLTLFGDYAGDETVLEWDYNTGGIWIKACELCFSDEKEVDEFASILKDMIRNHT